VLFVVADIPADYSDIKNALAALPQIGATDTFDSSSGTPTLAQLKNYRMVIVWAALPHANPVALGDALADYVDAGGAVIAATPSRIAQYAIAGRFRTGGYDPFPTGAGPLGSSSLGAFINHPTMKQPYVITTLSGDAREQVTLAPGATAIAAWADGNLLLAVKGQVAGLSAFLLNGYWSGDFPKLLANLGVFLAAERLTISPPSGVYVLTQGFDITLIVELPGGVTITGGSAQLNGADVTAILAACVIPGTLTGTRTGATYRCSGINGGVFGEGTHTFTVNLTLSDANVLSGTVTWQVYGNTEP
jgi:hypothetical protein